jgi:hypothetical protein
MWFFGKDKGKGKTDAAKAIAAPATPVSSKQAKADALMAQMRSLRAEIGEETLEKIVNKLKLDDLKKQMRSDIDTNPKKRDRLLDEIRLNMRDDD